MKRTQLYFDDEIRKSLAIRSRQSGKTISELVRAAVREKYASSAANRREAMLDWVGVWKDRRDLRNTEAYVRKLRKGKRLRRTAA